MLMTRKMVFDYRRWCVKHRKSENRITAETKVTSSHRTDMTID